MHLQDLSQNQSNANHLQNNLQHPIQNLAVENPQPIGSPTKYQHEPNLSEVCIY